MDGLAFNSGAAGLPTSPAGRTGRVKAGGRKAGSRGPAQALRPLTAPAAEAGGAGSADVFAVRPLTACPRGSASSPRRQEGARPPTGRELRGLPSRPQSSPRAGAIWRPPADDTDGAFHPQNTRPMQQCALARGLLARDMWKGDRLALHRLLRAEAAKDARRAREMAAQEQRRAKALSQLSPDMLRAKRRAADLSDLLDGKREVAVDEDAPPPTLLRAGFRRARVLDAAKVELNDLLSQLRLGDPTALKAQEASEKPRARPQFRVRRTALSELRPVLSPRGEPTCEGHEANGVVDAVTREGVAASIRARAASAGPAQTGSLADADGKREAPRAAESRAAAAGAAAARKATRSRRAGSAPTTSPRRAATLPPRARHAPSPPRAPHGPERNYLDEWRESTSVMGARIVAARSELGYTGYRIPSGFED